jgi:hypothetical protein
MYEQNNTLDNLRKLWSNKIITYEEYFFRIKSKELNQKN